MRREGLAIGVGVFAAAVWAAPAAAQNQCADPQQSCGAALSARCLDMRVGAGSMAAAGDEGLDCTAQFARYRDCLAEMARTCDAGQAGAGGAPQAAGGGCDADLEQRLWNAVAQSNDPEELTIFIESCPESPFSRVAERRIAAARSGAASGGSSSISVPSASVPSVTPPTVSPPAAPAAGPSEAEYRDAQRELRRLGLYRGGIDGDWGRGSQSAMRAFQRAEGFPEDGRLTAAALAALRAAPTPAAAAAPSFSGRYVGSWRDSNLGFGGRSEFQIISYDTASGAIQGRMSIEYQGLVSSGVVSGTLSASGGAASGELRAPNGTGWRTSLTYNPATSIDRITGSFRSRPLAGTFGIPISGVFETRLSR